ncbi:carbohydrate ABC transporter permease [Streptomyces enissocaesilis]|uniref:Carbohydrate ABC transporter permease n=1 Tax=Streptomyces enissocaesilis TaxID=332589 RepID=A0ABP6K811_9ACTN
MTPRSDKAVGSAAKHLFLGGAALLMLLPFVWMVLSAFKDFSQVFVVPPQWIPDPMHPSNFVDAWEALPFGRAYINSVYITVTIVVVQLLTCAMAAYAFARIRFPFRGGLFVLFLATLMVPTQLTIIPLYLVMREIGWLDTHWSIIVPSALFNAFGVFMLRQFIRGLPTSLEEAATIDGASRWKTFWLIVFPLLRAPMSALGIFSFMIQWNNFFGPLIFLSTPEKFTVPVLVAQFKGQHTTDFPLMMAAAALAVIPPLIVFLLLQRYIIEGVALTGLKR